MGAIWCIYVYIIALLFIMPTDAYLGAKMGDAQSACDDGKTNLTVDWDYSFTAYTCMAPRKWASSPTVQSFYYTIPNFDPKHDQVYHYCMNTSILYKDRPPIRGHHRPLWAKWGEYLYLPTQRWLHNLEHGSVVMLYHPCADEHEVNKLRELLTTCLYRHIITPYDKLTPERPLALVSWGAKLEMNVVSTEQVIMFIKKHAHKAPEDMSKQGQFEEMLIKPSAIVSDLEDKIVCPWAPDNYFKPDIYFDSSKKQPVDNNAFINGLWQNFLLTNLLRRLINDVVSEKRRQSSNFNQFVPFGRRRVVRQPTDTLPPLGPMLVKPNYVAAGTYLGSNPLQPLSVALPVMGHRVPNRTLLRNLILLLYLMRNSKPNFPTLTPANGFDSNPSSVVQSLISLLVGGTDGGRNPVANGRPLAPMRRRF